MTKDELMHLSAEEQYAQIKETIVTLVSERNDIREEITEKSRFREDLSLDSLDFTELVVNLERPLEICIPDADIDEVDTVGDLINATLKTLKK